MDPGLELVEIGAGRDAGAGVVGHVDTPSGEEGEQRPGLTLGLTLGLAFSLAFGAALAEIDAVVGLRAELDRLPAVLAALLGLKGQRGGRR
ncbi:MAG: hypothetical protein GEU86_13630 [Actinophytocola sp.]|nr:hypothetical protein [Actinophytocola sp.]